MYTPPYYKGYNRQRNKVISQNKPSKESRFENILVFHIIRTHSHRKSTLTYLQFSDNCVYFTFSISDSLNDVFFPTLLRYSGDKKLVSEKGVTPLSEFIWPAGITLNTTRPRDVIWRLLRLTNGSKRFVDGVSGKLKKKKVYVPIANLINKKCRIFIRIVYTSAACVSTITNWLHVLRTKQNKKRSKTEISLRFSEV